jgi:muramoyltetrapeptide carboxypeptidase LdcA involved in peptidoglycan recycling
MKFRQPPRLKQGDKIAIVSPSSGMPYLFPWVYEQGLERLRSVFGLVPIEFPSARQSPEFLSNNPKARADDINEAFADPEIIGIIATTGGNDQIKILPHLNKETILMNPKIFMGFSDCTNLHLFLWNLGIISYYGGSIMSQFAYPGEIQAYTSHSITKALFRPSLGLIQPAHEYTDADLDWSDKQNLNKAKTMYPSEGWDWHNSNDQILEGHLWGGCLEILHLHLSTRQYIPGLQELAGSVLFIETSEEMPTTEFVHEFITMIAELKILQQMKAILVAYPKAQFLEKTPSEARDLYIKQQKETIKTSLKDNKINIPTIFNMNFGHTDPQTIIPNGGAVRIDCKNRTIRFP